ncbi:hypothetical protein GH714_007660 [Hevea brasiliensis]|uniref:Uncharacterized protein n=1 Tax=Hevea brasiliensis TaxID=3981 RepID=A0A6A6NG56_HEVBR|nr:hypothetical protein GH714_007660 [Hevea brasiliensis]
MFLLIFLDGAKAKFVNEGANGDELSYGQCENGDQIEIMEEYPEENEAAKESQVSEVSNGNGNQIYVIHDKNRQTELVDHDRAPGVGVYYASIDILFDAGMLSTHRSEGMHAYFDGHVNSMSTLKQFVKQYEIALLDKHVYQLIASEDVNEGDEEFVEPGIE